MLNLNLSPIVVLVCVFIYCYAYSLLENGSGIPVDYVPIMFSMMNPCPYSSLYSSSILLLLLLLQYCSWKIFFCGVMFLQHNILFLHCHTCLLPVLIFLCCLKESCRKVVHCDDSDVGLNFYRAMAVLSTFSVCMNAKIGFHC